MSRSIHQTLRNVFGGKSKREIAAMVAEDEEGVRALAEKRRLKRETKKARKSE